METVTSVCGTCGAKVPEDATAQLCPACLLETGLGLLDEQSATDRENEAANRRIGELAPVPFVRFSPATSRSSQSAPILSELGDYELLEEIGRGGQGVVYRAHQKSLNRTVALKVIGGGPWTTESHLKRFRREAEAAAHLEHPCIVPIYEVGARDGQCYFSMQFIEGGQLDEVFNTAATDASSGERGPAPIRRAVQLIAKVARTVHYAHERGILHRDIKPGNILLDHNGEPHLTDFGLARLVENESTITGTREVLGTPSYMAPEQAVGNNAQLTSATDVYGLGAVLYQLLTGKPPFAGGTTYETVKLLLETEPRQPRLLNAKVDRDLSAICLKCLEKDPKRRYPSALALAEDLDRWLKHEPIRAKRSGFLTHGRKWIRRNPTPTVLVASLVTLAIGFSVNVWNRQSQVVIPKSVAVLPFQNLSADPDNAYFGDAMQEEILTRLASIEELKVISRTSTQNYESKPRNLPQIAKQLGVANILEGSVQKVGNRVRVNVQLINAQTDSHLWAETYDQKVTDILAVESEIAKGIAESLRTKLTGREEQALAKKPTNNPEAYDAYLRGLAFEGRSYGTDVIVLTQAAGSYERAVQLDPNFAIAWARLSRANALIYAAEAVDPKRRDEAKRALENAQRLEPNSAETLLALGYYQYAALEDFSAAKITLGRVSKMRPGNSDVSYALGLINRTQGDWNQSIVCWEQALALDPRNVQTLSAAAATHVILRQFPSALKLYNQALDIMPDDADVKAEKAGIYQAQGNVQGAASLLSQINEQTPSIVVFWNKLIQLRLNRNYNELIRFLKARQSQSDDQYSRNVNQVFLAFAQRFANDAEGAKTAAQQARDTFEKLYRDQPDNAGIGAALSLAYAAMGEKDLALKAAERAIILCPRAKDPYNGPRYEETLAFIQTMFGQNGPAISTLARLLQTPYDSWLYGSPITPALLRLDPFWDPLRGDPAFQKLCEEKQDVTTNGH